MRAFDHIYEHPEFTQSDPIPTGTIAAVSVGVVTIAIAGWGLFALMRNIV
jgi:hypothetical protein